MPYNISARDFIYRERWLEFRQKLGMEKRILGKGNHFSQGQVAGRCSVLGTTRGPVRLEQSLWRRGGGAVDGESSWGQRLRESNEHKDGGLAGRERGGWRQGGHSKLE